MTEGSARPGPDAGSFTGAPATGQAGSPMPDHARAPRDPVHRPLAGNATPPSAPLRTEPLPDGRLCAEGAGRAPRNPHPPLRQGGPEPYARPARGGSACAGSGSGGSACGRSGYARSNWLEDFRRTLAAAELGWPEVVADGHLHRFALPEDRRGEKTGWYCLFADGVPAGAFGSWREGEVHRWSARKAEALTAAERDALQRRMERARRLREKARAAEADTAASVSAGLWNAARQADPAHPYLRARGVDALGLRQAGGALLVPMRDAAGRLRGVQRILPDGSKRFVRGVAKAGLFHRIEGGQDAVYVCEGYATGASLHMATGQTVIVAFDAGNLEPVARAVRTLLPAATLIVAADNDRHTRRPDGTPWNTGLEHARKAAAAAGAQVLWPEFANPASPATDFNDLHRLEGLDAVRRQAAGPDCGPRLTDWDVGTFAGQARPQRWLVDQTLPLGAPCLLAAAGGTGKGLLLLDLGLAVAGGLPAQERTPAGNLSTEGFSTGDLPAGDLTAGNAGAASPVPAPSAKPALPRAEGMESGFTQPGLTQPGLTQPGLTQPHPATPQPAGPGMTDCGRDCGHVDSAGACGKGRAATAPATGALAAKGLSTKGLSTGDLPAGDFSTGDLSAGDGPLWLGHRVVARGTAVILAAEDSREAIHQRLCALDPDGTRRAAAAGRLFVVPLPSAGGPVTLAVAQTHGAFGVTPGFAALRRQLGRFADLRLLVIDPLACFVGLDINKDPQAGQYVQGVLAGLAEETGATVLVAHHMAKAGREGRLNAETARDAIRGTTALVDGARCVVAIWPADGAGREARAARQAGDGLFEAAVVKNNAPADRAVRLLQRQPSGLLVAVPRSPRAATGAHPGPGELLAAAIARAAGSGRPFTRSGQTGLYARRDELPDSLRGLARNRLETLLNNALDARLVVACAAGRGVARWLDAPCGPFASGQGAFDPDWQRAMIHPGGRPRTGTA